MLHVQLSWYCSQICPAVFDLDILIFEKVTATFLANFFKPNSDLIHFSHLKRIVSPYIKTELTNSSVFSVYLYTVHEVRYDYGCRQRAIILNTGGGQTCLHKN